MKFCSECGAQLNDDARFCNKCGAQVSNEIPAGTHDAYKEEYEPASAQETPKTRSGKRGNGGKIAFIIIAAVLVIAIIVAVILISKSGNKKEADSQEEIQITTKAQEDITEPVKITEAADDTKAEDSAETSAGADQTEASEDIYKINIDDFVGNWWGGQRWSWTVEKVDDSTVNVSYSGSSGADDNVYGTGEGFLDGDVLFVYMEYTHAYGEYDEQGNYLSYETTYNCTDSVTPLAMVGKKYECSYNEYILADDYIMDSTNGMYYAYECTNSSDCESPEHYMLWYSNIYSSKEYLAQPKKLSQENYDFIIEDCTFEEAKMKAVQMGGHLVNIDSADEFLFITQLLNDRELNNIQFKIGAERQGDYTEYHWFDSYGTYSADVINSPDYWAHSYWMSNEPSFYDGDIVENKVCIWDIKRNGNWTLNDIPNDVISIVSSYSGKIGYIVEYD